MPLKSFPLLNDAVSVVSAQLGEYRGRGCSPERWAPGRHQAAPDTPALPGLNHKSFLKTTTRVNANISNSQQQPGSGPGIQTQEKWFLVCTRTMALSVLACLDCFGGSDCARYSLEN